MAAAQVRVGRDSSTRLNRFGRDLIYGTGMGLLFAEVDHLRHEPPEWGKGWEGYRKRAASDIGEFVIQEGTTSKEGKKMPAFKSLSEEQVKALVAYMKSLKK